MRLRFRGGIYSSPEVCDCGGCPGGYRIRPYGLWDAFIHPMGACCDGHGHGSSGTPTSAAAAGPGMPGPYRTMILKKAQKAAAMRFLHSCGFIYTLLRAHISGVTGTAP